MSYHWDKTGNRFPTQSGSPVLITQTQFEDCCCVIYALTPCSATGNARCPGGAVIYTDTDLSAYVSPSKVVDISGTCYTVAVDTGSHSSGGALTVSSSYDNCADCCVRENDWWLHYYECWYKPPDPPYCVGPPTATTGYACGQTINIHGCDCAVMSCCTQVLISGPYTTEALCLAAIP